MSGEEDEESEDSLLREIARIDGASVTDAPEAARASGSRLGRFVVRGELGRGGMGIAYRADDEQLGRPVALKVLRDKKRNDPQRRARFLREARSAAALVHPRVATVYEVGETDGELYIAMELVVGESLRERLTRNGALPLEEALPIAKGIARALSAAHAKGIVHRDLKPENVMLDADGEPKVLDFGLAKIDELVTPPREVLERQSTAAVLTEEGHVLGTPAYMSPEQAQGRAVDVRSDVFSFGIVLFEMLAGERPFKGESGMDMAIAIARDEPIDLARLKPGLPRWVTTLVATCLAKAPAERYASGRELREALEDAGGKIAAAKPRRRPAVLLASAAAAAAALVAVVILVLPLPHRTLSPAASVAPIVSAVGSDGGSAAPRSITSYPRPLTKSAAAADAYASAMQDLRDGTVEAAQVELRLAVKLDPTFAAAYLRLLSSWWQESFSRVTAQKDYALAQQFRSALDARDRALLAAAEPVTRDAVDWKELIARLRLVLTQFPDDIDTLMQLGNALYNGGEMEEARTTLQHVLQLDPEFAFPLLDLAWTHVATDMDGARDIVERCLTVSPRAASCLAMRALIERETGRCADYEATGRRFVATSPTSKVAYLLLADALAVRGASLEAVDPLLEKAATLEGEQDGVEPMMDRNGKEVAEGLLVGDFPRAIAGATQAERLLGTAIGEGEHIASVMTIITSLIEEGQDDRAVRVAEDFERRAPSLSLDDDRVRHYLLFARRHAGRIDEATFHQQLDALEREDTEHQVAMDIPTAIFYVHVADADGSDADLKVARPYLDRPMWSGHNEALRGHLLFLSGRLDEALPPLERGARTCEILPTDTGAGWQGMQAFSFMHSRLWLGAALEAKGDTTGACANYAVIEERWKNARPRSVTVEKAKARSRALHCVAPP